MNLQFIRATWKSSPLEKMNSKLVQDMTVYLEPCLAKIPYDKTKQLSEPLSPAKRYLTLIRRLARNRLFAMSRIGRTTRDGKKSDFWDAVFFDDSKGYWQSYIDARELRLAISRQPSSSLLWNMATIEMFRKAIE